MGKEILQKYTIFEVKRHLAEMEKQYGKERVSEMFGKDQAAKFNREFEKLLPNGWYRIGRTFKIMKTAAFWCACVYESNNISGLQRRVQCTKARPASHCGRYAARHSCIL